jgi:hypothetical protein
MNARLYRMLERVKALELPLRRSVLPDRFTRIEVETSSRCNKGCGYCPVSVVRRPDHLMERELFMSIVDQLAEMKFRGRFSPHFFGEPLLDPRLPELLSYVRQKLPSVSLMIYSNGDALTPKKAQALLQAGVDLILVTLEDADYPSALQQTRTALGPLRFRRRIWVRHFDRDVQLPYNRGGTVFFPQNTRKMSACMAPATALVVDAWGKVKLCANDYSGIEDWGDLHTERLIDIWNRPNFVKTRQDLLNGHFERQLCRVCSGHEAAPAPLATYAPIHDPDQAHLDVRLGIR